MYKLLAMIAVAVSLQSCDGQNDGIPKGAPKEEKKPQGMPTASPKPSSGTPKPDGDTSKPKELDPEKFVKRPLESPITPTMLREIFPQDCPLDNKLVTFLVFSFHSRQDINEIKHALKSMVIDTPYFIPITAHARNANVDNELLYRAVSQESGKEQLIEPKDYPPLVYPFNVIMKPQLIDNSVSTKFLEPEKIRQNLKLVCDGIRELEKRNLSPKDFKQNLNDMVKRRLISGD